MPISAERKALALLTPRPPLFCPHEPGVRQQVFLYLDELEALYGGAAGGGKSDALLMGALQYVDVPGYAALLLRKTFAELAQPGALLDRADQWLRTNETNGPHWNGNDKQWTFPSGAVIQFGYLATEVDKYRYQSAEFQFIGVDELTEFRESQYRFLISRGRRPSSGPLSKVPIRVRGATNPGGVGHDWVKQHFIPEVDIYGVRHLKYDERTGQLRPFVPAKLNDNPHVDRDQYRAGLNHLDPVTRERLLNGDWDVKIGGMFSRLWFGIEQEPPPAKIVTRRLRYWDTASTEEAPGKDPDYTVGTRVAFDVNREIWVEDVIRFRRGPMHVENTIIQTAQADGRAVPIYIEREPGSEGKLWLDYLIRRLAGYTVIAAPVLGKKAERAAPFASYAEAGHVKLVQGPWIADWLAEMEGFSEDPKQVAHDDQVDSASGAFGVIVVLGQKAQSTSTIPSAREPIVRRGDLILRGEQYVDKEPAR